LLTATTFEMTPPMPSPVRTAGASWVLPRDLDVTHAEHWSDAA
jgi:hypothetical protein